MSSSYYRQWTPDVFVSFKDKEVESFTSVLFARLKRAGIGCRDSSKGVDKLDKAIRHARFALVVFSANYVCSSCLDELVKILFRRGNSKYPSLVVIPIFHGMDPAKVPKALDSFHGKEKDEKNKEWSRALAEVEGISCYDLKKDANDDESVLIDKIVERLVNEIWSLYSHKVFGPFGDSGATSWHFDEKTRNGVVCAEFINTLPFGKVKLNKDEGIISFSGYFQWSKNSRRIEALTFLTTKDKTLRVGRNVDGREADFSVPLPPYAGKVIELFGSKNGDGVLTSIGARVELKRLEIPPEVSCPVGLFGSRRGVKWDDNQHSTVKGIKAVHDGCIRSIAFLFDDGKWRSHGSDKKPLMKFIIHDPDEYLSSISGYHTYDGITSLTFLTSKKSTVTIGDEKGTYFSSPKMGYKIVGFYGWSNENLLYGIGAYFKPIPDLYPVKSIGPFGGIAWDDGKFKGVKKIHIFNKNGICYIKIVYDNNGKERPIIHGDYTREFSNNEDTVDLKYPQEYLTSISGYMQDDGSIESLIFHSNRRIIHFGRLKGKYFGYPSNKSRIIGFYGTFGKTLNSIGVYAEPIPDWKPVINEPFSSMFPGSDMIDWDDGEHSNVVGYRVTEFRKSEESPKIESITFMYENNGSLVEGSRHGGGDPSSGDWVMLDYPRERLDRIRGYSRVEDGETIIHDLKIVTTYINQPCTNWTYAERGEPDSDSESKSKKKSKSQSKRKSEPESEREWPKQFTIPGKSDEGRRIVRFFGKAKTCLNSIGAYLEP